MADDNILKFVPKKPSSEEVIRLRPGQVYRLTEPGRNDIVIDSEWVRVGNCTVVRDPEELVPF